jgi:osmotically-inducible protein OsmY
LYKGLAMSGDRRNASSYDEIVRRTVPNPDTSFRASIEEEHLSRHRAGKAADHIPHAPTAEEQETLARVRAALASDPSIDLDHVRLAMDGRELVLRGNVPGPATSARIEDVAGNVRGVDRIDNQLAIRGPK